MRSLWLRYAFATVLALALPYGTRQGLAAPWKLCTDVTGGIQPGVGVGPIRLGMPLGSIARILKGKPIPLHAVGTNGYVSTLYYDQYENLPSNPTAPGRYLFGWPPRLTDLTVDMGNGGIVAVDFGRSDVPGCSLRGDIGFGSSPNDLVAALGEPDLHSQAPGNTWFIYDRLGIRFTFNTIGMDLKYGVHRTEPDAVIRMTVFKNNQFCAIYPQVCDEYSFHIP
jgi:hypothetical protein